MYYVSDLTEHEDHASSAVELHVNQRIVTLTTNIHEK